MHWNKQKYFDAFALLWDDTKRSNCPGRAGFAKARYMKSFSLKVQRNTKGPTHKCLLTTNKKISHEMF